MPKRDEGYMQKQRDAITRAALEVLVEKGYHETTLRDICRAAGVSNGALYSYFPTRESVMIAACLLDQADYSSEVSFVTWQEYVNFVPFDEMASPGSAVSKRFRLSLQFTAEISQMPELPEGLFAVFEENRRLIGQSLRSLFDRGKITLPFGLELTIDMHEQLFLGYGHQHMLNRHARADEITHAFQTSLALTAGLVESQANVSISKARERV
ncbi:MAG: TetR/AcrR family transcriptional regulator [Chakrabartia sp.]